MEELKITFTPDNTTSDIDLLKMYTLEVTTDAKRTLERHGVVEHVPINVFGVFHMLNDEDIAIGNGERLILRQKILNIIYSYITDKNVRFKVTGYNTDRALDVTSKRLKEIYENLGDLIYAHQLGCLSPKLIDIKKIEEARKLVYEGLEQFSKAIKNMKTILDNIKLGIM